MLVAVTENSIMYSSDRQERGRKYYGNDTTQDKACYRIYTKDGRVLYTGTERGSWFTLEEARKIVNRSKGEMIYKCNGSDKLWEIL